MDFPCFFSKCNYAGAAKVGVSPVKRKRTRRIEGTCLEGPNRKSRASPISVKVEPHKKHVSIVSQNSFTKEMTAYSIHSLLVSASASAVFI